MTIQVDFVYQYCELNMTKESFVRMFQSLISNVLMKIGKFPLSKEQRQDESFVSLFAPICFRLRQIIALFVVCQSENNFVENAK